MTQTTPFADLMSCYVRMIVSFSLPHSYSRQESQDVLYPCLSFLGPRYVGGCVVDIIISRKEIVLALDFDHEYSEVDHLAIPSLVDFCSTLFALTGFLHRTARLLSWMMYIRML